MTTDTGAAAPLGEKQSRTIRCVRVAVRCTEVALYLAICAYAAWIVDNAFRRVGAQPAGTGMPRMSAGEQAASAISTTGVVVICAAILCIVVFLSSSLINGHLKDRRVAAGRENSSATVEQLVPNKLYAIEGNGRQRIAYRDGLSSRWVLRGLGRTGTVVHFDVPANCRGAALEILLADEFQYSGTGWPAPERRTVR